MRPQRCRVVAPPDRVTPRGASLSGVRAASWRFAPYCSHGTRSLKLPRGRAALQWCFAQWCRHTLWTFAGHRPAQYSDLCEGRGIFCLSRGGCHEAELLIDGNCDYEPRQKWLLYLSSGRRNGSNAPRKRR